MMLPPGRDGNDNREPGTARPDFDFEPHTADPNRDAGHGGACSASWKRVSRRAVLSLRAPTNQRRPTSIDDYPIPGRGP
jgi:hypothetical protein